MIFLRNFVGDLLPAGGCVPPATEHSTVRLLQRISIDDDPKAYPELSHADAVALDHQLGVLADATAQTDPWTAALTQTGADQ